MNFSSIELLSGAAQLRAMSEELEQAGRKLAELEGSPIFKVLAALQANAGAAPLAQRPEAQPPAPGATPTFTPSPVPVVRVRSTFPTPELPALQKDLIPYLLKRGPMTRDELFATMQNIGRAPNDVGQLSALLSRAKAEGVLANTDGRWHVTPPGAAATSQTP